MEKFIKKEKIGEGVLGKVYKVLNKETNQIYAAKILKLLTNIPKDQIDSINHPAILNIIEHGQTDFKSEIKPIIITEFMPNGSLFAILDSERCNKPYKKWDDTQKLITIYGIASGMSFLHSKNIIHTNLKPSNILMDRYLQPKITDFYFPKQIQENRNSIIYYPPEFLKNNEYSKSTDVYSFGIILYEILTAEKPFQDFSIFQIYNEVVNNGFRPNFSKPIKEIYKNLIERCLSQNPEKRPTFQSIVKELKNNRSYITNSTRKKDFINYIEFIESNKKCIEKRNKYKSILFLGHFDDEQVSLEKEIINLDGKSNFEKENFYKNQPDIHKFLINGYKCNIWILVGNVKPTIYLQNLIRKVNIILFTFNLNEPETLEFLMKEWYPIIEKVDEFQSENQERILIGIYPKESNEYNLSEIYSKLGEIKEQLNITKYFEYGKKPKSLEHPAEFDIEISRQLIQYLSDNLEKEEKEEEGDEFAEEEEGKEEEFLENKIKDFTYILFLGKINDELQPLEERVINLCAKSAKEEEEGEEDKRFNEKHSNIHRYRIKGYKSYAFILFGDIKPKSLTNLIRKIDIILFTFKLNKPNTLKILKQEWQPIIAKVDENKPEKQERFLIGIYLQGSKKTEYNLTKTYSKLKDIKKELNCTEYFEYGKKPKFLKNPTKKKVPPRLIEYLSINLIKEEKEEEEDKKEFIEEEEIENQNDIKDTENEESNDEKENMEELNKNIKEEEENEEKDKEAELVRCEKKKDHILFIGKFDNELLSLEKEVINLGGNSAYDTKFEQHRQYFLKSSIKGYKCEAYILISDVKPTENAKNLIRKAKFILFTFNLNELETLEFLMEEWYPIIEKFDEFQSENQERILIGIYPKESKANEYNLSEIYSKLGEIKELLNITKYFEYGKKPKSLEHPAEFDIEISRQLIQYLSDNLDKEEEKYSSEEGKEEQIQKDFKEEEEFIENNIAYKLIKKGQTAEIIESPKAEGMINISKFLKYKTINIASYSFSKSLITIFQIINESDITFSTKSFEKCETLKSIIIQTTKSVHISANNFNEIPNLESINIKCSQLIIENNCFNNTCFIKSKSDTNNENKIIQLESEEISVGYNCFNQLNHIDKIELKGKNIDIRDNCFGECEYLSSFNISKNDYLSLGKNEFKACQNLSELRLKSSQIKLGDQCFSTSKLTNIEIICEEINIYNGCFSNLSTIKNFTINDSKTINISENSFSGCQNLGFISLKCKETLNIGNSSFFKSESLETIFIDCPKINIGEYCFMECKSLSSIVLEKVSEINILNKGFSECESLKELSINTLSKIKLGRYCFSGCKNLLSIELSSEQIMIKESCFENCFLLSSLSFPSVDELNIGSNSFDRCNNIKQISILKSRRVYLGQFCFQKAQSLSNIEINTDQLTFDENCFSECNSLQSLIFENAKNIVFNPKSFNKCSNLQNISITNSCLISFAETCFNELNKLSSLQIQSKEINDIEKFIKLCASLTKFTLDTIQPIEITQNTFQNCLSLSEIDISSENSITFTKRCFFNSKSIKYIKIKSKETKIEDECFSSSSIQLIIIESTKLDIFYRSFSNCNNLSTIIFNNIQSIFISKNVFVGCPSLKDIEISAASQIKLNENCFTGAFNIETIKLKSKEVIIYNNCFYNCTKLKTLIFAELQNAKIGSCAFSGCKELKKIDISAKSKVELDRYCFDGIYNIESVTINTAELIISNKSFKNNSLTKICIINAKNVIINSDTFGQCPKLKEIYIYSSENVTIGKCFYEMQSLESITISSREINFLVECFKYHNNLTNISIENSEKVTIEERSFIYCSKFKSLNLNNVQSIDIRSNAFSSCSELKNIYIKTENEIHLQNYCFFGVQNLETISLNSKEVIIGDHCFKMCQKLSSIKLNEVENATIGQEAFEVCNSLIGIQFKVKSNLTICDYCFSNTNNLANIVLSGNYLKIGLHIFKDCYSLKYASLESLSGSETNQASFKPRNLGSELDLSKLKRNEY